MKVINVDWSAIPEADTEKLHLLATHQTECGIKAIIAHQQRYSFWANTIMLMVIAVVYYLAHADLYQFIRAVVMCQMFLAIVTNIRVWWAEKMFEAVSVDVNKHATFIAEKYGTVIEETKDE